MGLGINRHRSNWGQPYRKQKIVSRRDLTGTPAKEKTWADQYNIPQKNIYNYQNFDNIASNPDIDIVYVVLPVSMHKEFTIRAAQAGKHVISEKPMAISVTDCEEMISACRNAGKKLSIGYRLRFDPYNKEMMRLGQQKIYGKPLQIDCANGFYTRMIQTPGD